jgi:hypothetical protein
VFELGSGRIRKNSFSKYHGSLTSFDLADLLLPLEEQVEQLGAYYAGGCGMMPPKVNTVACQ